MTKRTFGDLEFFVWGKDPKILLCSGMHGDEYQTADLLRDYVSSNYKDLPDFVYIPLLSKSAYHLRTRYNKYRHDLNRSFIPDMFDPEALEITKLLSGYKFDICLDWHEDFDLEKEFYICDSGATPLNLDLSGLGINLFSGIEDPNDPLLQVEVKSGYVYNNSAEADQNQGFISDWLYSHGIVKRTLVFEIPMKANLDSKKQIMDKMLKFIIERRLVHR